MELQELYQVYLKHPVVCTDTRKLQPGCLFFALGGGNFDGNAFASQAIALGAAFAVIDNPGFAHGNQYIVVENVLHSLQQLARHHRQQLTCPVIAITGSNGKTTTKELLAAVLHKKYITYATEGNLNNHIGIPLTLLKIIPDAEMAIVEMGANHQKEIEGYCKIALPTHGIITNCGKAHIEGFGGEEGVRKGKGELYDYLRAANGTIFINTGLDYLSLMAEGIPLNHRVTYGTENATYIGEAATARDGLFLHICLEAPEKSEIATHLVGGYNLPNALLAIAAGLHFGVSLGDIKDALANYQPDNSRSQWLQKGTNQIILDAYNANPSSMKEAILNFAAANLPNKILWIGGMKEMGPAEVQEHQDLVALIASYTWASVILVGKEFMGIQNNYQWFSDSAEALKQIAANPPQNSSILIKGSRGSKMEVLLGGI